MWQLLPLTSKKNSFKCILNKKFILLFSLIKPLLMQGFFVYSHLFTFISKNNFHKGYIYLCWKSCSLEGKIKINYYSYFKFIHMNANVKGMLWTASAVIVGILVAGLIKDKLLAPSTAE